MLSVSCSYYLISRSGDRPDRHSFPTRRSSDLAGPNFGADRAAQSVEGRHEFDGLAGLADGLGEARAVDAGDFGFADRKSTRLNSSHANISYAVFCLKKKKIAHAATKHVSAYYT